MTRFFSLTLAGLMLATLLSFAVAAEPKKEAAPPVPPVDARTVAWPPKLPGMTNGSATLASPGFLVVPESVKKDGESDVAMKYVVAKTPPTVTLYVHPDLGDQAVARRTWSAWGDIGLASDGRVYCGIGDHNDDKNGDARCFIYCYDPAKKTLTKVVDMNEVNPPKPGRPSWSKVHAKIDEANDGKIYVSCTMNDGNQARNPEFKFDKDLPGGQLYQYDPKTGKTVAYLTLPTDPGPTCTATSLLDRDRNIWWCNLEGGGKGDALWAVDLATKKEVFRAPTGSMGFNRAFALASDGSVYFNSDSEQTKKYAAEDGARNKARLDARAKAREAAAAAAAAKERGETPPVMTKEEKVAAAVAAKEAKAKAKADDEAYAAKVKARGPQDGLLMKVDGKTHKISDTGARFPGCPGMRCATRESADGYIYGVTRNTDQLYRISVKDNKLTMLGDPWLSETYTAVIELSPDEKYLYYLPGAHGGARRTGTPVIQYEIATGQRKVLAFLAPALSEAFHYTPAGTYGMKVTPDGGTLYVNFNGDPTEEHLAPAVFIDANNNKKFDEGEKKLGAMIADGFGLTSFAVIEIPETER